MSQKIVVIGNGPAGMSTVGAVKITDRAAEITVIDTKSYDTFHPCAMPFVIGGYLPSVDSIIEDLNYEKMKISHMKNSVVKKIDTKQQEITYQNRSDKKKITIDYDKLIICTGSNVFIPPIKGHELDNVFSLKYAEDAKAIKEAISKIDEKQDRVQKVIIVGGSAIGIEVASEISHLGKEVTIIEMQPQLMPFKISAEFAELVKKALIKIGVNVRTGMAVNEIIGNDKVRRISFGHEKYEETIDADIVVLATGVRPNVELAKEAGLKMNNKFRAIEVNEKMETSAKNVYAAGDCIVTNHLVTGEKTVAWLAGPAVRQGRVAGINAAGGKAEYPGTVNSFIVSSRNFYVGLTGINEEQAKERGIKAIKQKITAPIRPHYMPTSKEITLKLIAQEDDGKILGLEAIGPEKIDVNVNYIALALQTGLTVYDLMDIDFCYAPAVSETIYPLVKVADAIIRKLERKKARAKKK